jgi:hypothetical protein
MSRPGFERSTSPIQVIRLRQLAFCEVRYLSPPLEVDGQVHAVWCQRHRLQDVPSICPLLQDPQCGYLAHTLSISPWLYLCCNACQFNLATETLRTQTVFTEPSLKFLLWSNNSRQQVSKDNSKCTLNKDLMSAYYLSGQKSRFICTKNKAWKWMYHIRYLQFSVWRMVFLFFTNFFYIWKVEFWNMALNLVRFSIFCA